MPETLIELAERCERAEGPDRELDAAVFRALGMPLPTHIATVPIGLEYDAAERCFLMPLPMSDMRVRYEHPEYTASIDAALTLKGEIGVLITLSEIKGDGMPMCIIGNPATAELFEASAATPALALVAAALRARAHLENARDQG